MFVRAQGYGVAPTEARVGSDAESGAAGKRGGVVLCGFVGRVVLCGILRKVGLQHWVPRFAAAPPAPRGYADQYVGGLSVRDYHM
jgi:hypothetical protein